MTDKTDKKKFWLTSAEGGHAYVEGATERDRLVPLGWRETDEPIDPDAFLWMSHEGIELPARFPVGARADWEGRGWTPSGPPAHVDPTKDPAPVEAPAAPVEKSKPAAVADKNSKE